MANATPSPYRPVDYDALSGVYDDVRDADLELLRTLADGAKLARTSRVLDIGCGTGNHAVALARLTGACVAGVDPSEGMLAKAIAKGSPVDFRSGDAAHIPFDDAALDFAFMTDVIHHVPDLDAMWSEIARVLRPGAQACVVTQSHEQISGRAIARFFPETVAIDQARYPSIERIVASAAAAGLHRERVETLAEGTEGTIDADFLVLAEKRGYSMLHLLGDDAYAAGLRTLREALIAGPFTVPTAGVTLIWVARGAGDAAASLGMPGNRSATSPDRSDGRAFRTASRAAG